MTLFYLGTHRPEWLGRLSVPLFVSHRRLVGRKTFPRASAPWALDSGGFSELSMYGAWQTTPHDYVASVRRYVREIGWPDFVAIQDWMCEPWIIERTGASVRAHQALTVASYLTLVELAPDIPWLPVVQGWEPADYVRHLEMYARADIDLTGFPVVGVGSVCRRQNSAEALLIMGLLEAQGLRRLHGFGFKVEGLRNAGGLLHSADSMAWSFGARKSPPLPGCTHKNCANCERYALQWRERVISGELTASAWQMCLPLAA